MELLLIISLALTLVYIMYLTEQKSKNQDKAERYKFLMKILEPKTKRRFYNAYARKNAR